MNWGIGGHTLSQASSDAATIDALLTAGSRQGRYILSVEIGANDLGTAPSFGGNPSGFLTALASYCDARRAAGWKVVVHTIMSRTDQTSSGAQFNVDRATVNTAIRGWVGTHADAIADWASDATMGTDSAPNNATNFQDQVHPTPAGYLLLEPYTRAAINSL